MKYFIVILLLLSCGKETATVTNVHTAPDIVDEPKPVCYKYYKKPKRKYRKCKLVYIADSQDINCKCRYRRR
jgi:hypothetical protein